jgi:hypothetical protein
MSSNAVCRRNFKLLSFDLLTIKIGNKKYQQQILVFVNELEEVMMTNKI